MGSTLAFVINESIEDFSCLPLYKTVRKVQMLSKLTAYTVS